MATACRPDAARRRKGRRFTPRSARTATAGRDPRDFGFSKDPKAQRTIGNYWPYATTVFDYIRRAMPPDAPGSLTDGEVYAVSAHLFRLNELIPADAVMDAATLPKVAMPAKERFKPGR